MGFVEKKKKGFYGWISLSISAIVGTIGAGGMIYSFGVFLPSICKDLMWSRGLASGAMGLLMIVMCISAPLAGVFISKRGPRQAFVVGNAMGAAGLILLSVQQEVWQFYTGYGLIGLGVGLGGMIAATTIANNWFRKKATLAMGIVMAASGAGGIFMVPGIMAGIGRYGWRTTYVVLSGLVLIFGVLLPGFFVRNRPEDLGQAPDGIPGANASGSAELVLNPGGHLHTVHFTVQEAIRTSTFWYIIVAGAMSAFLLSMFMAHEVAFLTGIGINPATAAMALGLLSGISTLGNLVIGALAVKFDLKRLAIASNMIVGIGVALMLLTRTLPMAFAFTVVYGLGYGASMVSFMGLLSSFFGPKDFPKIMGAMMIFCAIGNAGAPIAGVIYDSTKSYTPAFVLGLLAALLGLVSMVCMRRPVRAVVKTDR